MPKSFLYASNWKNLRYRLLDGLEILVDCGRAWDEVLLEQVIYIHRKDAKTASYRNFKRVGQSIASIGSVDKRECRRFGFLLNDVDELELQIARKMLESGEFLDDYSFTTGGGDMQNRLSMFKRGRAVIGGANVQRYFLRGLKGYCEANLVPEKAGIKVGNILVQDILAFIENPMKHIKITAHLVQEGESHHAILNTINQVVITSKNLSPKLVLALFNSKLINWYVYRFIYSKPIRIMHFNRPVISRIPLPNFADQPDLVAKISAQVESIYANRQANQKLAQERIDRYIFQLYRLSAAQIALVEANMP